MALIVQKFGGTSVAGIPQIQNAARRIAYECKRGHKVVAVVSAMAGMTDQLLSYIQATTPNPNPQEIDVVLTSGEQVTCGLLALALQNFNISARSYLAWQIPLETDDTHTKARVKEISTHAIEKTLNANAVPIIAGFQGIGSEGRLTTFGRGGSDVTAVALAAVLKADRCDLYKDVSGIYTADPKIVEQARKLDQIGYKSMLELASLGSKVIQHRAVELAMAYKIPVRIFSSFEESIGTQIIDEEQMIERPLVSGIVANTQEVSICLEITREPSKTMARIFDCFAQAHIGIDMIQHAKISEGHTFSLSFTVNQIDLQTCLRILEDEGIATYTTNEKTSKVSVVGVGLRSHSHLTSLLFQTLSAKNIELFGISTSEIRISVLIDQDFTELAVRALHHAYNLEHSSQAPHLYAIA
ncbi:hypothetical protein IM40_07170 [Candidatus Paracaedimonas acanthamoebae]|nr:hypothetical protein IM40_07170 [Candidatus Paracaedimonas acanthamoebae]